jgi:hypothetical protein
MAPSLPLRPGRRLRRPLTAALLLPLLLVTCKSGGGGPTDPPPPAHPTLTIITSSLPAGVLGEPYAEAVHASGGDGAYQWDVVSGALPLGTTLMVSDLGPDHALISGIPERAETATFTLRVRSGDGQAAQRTYTLVVHAELAAVAIQSKRVPPALVGGPYAVRLLATGGDGLSYSWQVVEGNLPAGLTLASTGHFQGTPTAAGEASFLVEVRSGGASARQFLTLRVVAPDPSAFRFTLFPVSDVPPAVQPHLDAAVARLEAAVVGNLQPIQIPPDFFAAGNCGGFGWMMNGTSTDDLLIAVNIVSIDGPGGVLGRAGPCGVRQTSQLPFVGVVILDADDMVPLAGTETLTDLITHELAHVLGFGSLWEMHGHLAGKGTGDPRYTGPRGMAEYQALGGTGQVPVEDQGGEGTRDSHWRKAVFHIELMTGFAEKVGIAQPMSRVTLGSFQDLGFTVNMAAAESFSLSLALQRGDWSALGHDELLGEPVRVLGEEAHVEIQERP